MIVTHSKGEYQIHFANLSELQSHLPGDAPIITDTNVGSIFPDLLKGRPALQLPPGEEQKTLTRFSEAIEWLASQKTSRSATIIALGGGVIGDLVGYVAASYMRGINFIQVPTTLLAQVDSSVGGKVGVDLPQGKNLVGAFHPPSSVVICTEALKTLDERQFTNGMAEVWKYGFIRDPELVEELRDLNLNPSHPQLEAIVRRCIRHKRDVVEADEMEINGLRATLNFGHTIGHAIEQATGYTEYLHGEAIGIGMVAEAQLSENLGLAQKGTTEKVQSSLASQGLPTKLKEIIPPETLIQAMRLDKKAKSGKLAFSLLTRIGECKLVEDVPERDAELALAEL